MFNLDYNYGKNVNSTKSKYLKISTNYKYFRLGQTGQTLVVTTKNWPFLNLILMYAISDCMFEKWY